MSTTRDVVIAAVVAERERQEALKAAGKFLYTCADPQMSEAERLVVLAEEAGEVAKAVCERMHKPHLSQSEVRAELVQTAAVCVAWLEAL